MAFQRTAFQVNFQQALQAGAAQGLSIVLFPPEPTRFRAKVDRGMYVLAMIARDSRGGWRAGNDALPSIIAPSFR